MTPTATAGKPDRAREEGGPREPSPAAALAVPLAKRPKRTLALASVAAAALLAMTGATVLMLPAKRLLAVRSALFYRRIEFAKFRELAALPPEGWIAQESPEARAPSHRALLARLPALAIWLDGPLISDAEEATALLAMLPPTAMACSKSRDLMDKSEGLLSGIASGCCSDFVEVFQFLASLRGLNTREIANRRHNFVEYWDAAHRHWNAVDPTFGLLAEGPAGAPMSALEAALAPSAVTWRVVGEHAAFNQRISRRIAAYYSVDSFRELVVTERSDVVAQDAFDRKLRFLPKAIAQLIELIMGARPRWTEVQMDQPSVKTE